MCFDLTYSDKMKRKRRTLRPKKAKEDIIVYKAIYKNGSGLMYNLKDEQGYDMKWEPGYQYTELGKTQLGIYYIDGGMLHSKKEYKDAYNSFVAGYTKIFMVVKMIIPKGTSYYENATEYVSKSLIYPHQNEVE